MWTLLPVLGDVFSSRWSAKGCAQTFSKHNLLPVKSPPENKDAKDVLAADERCVDPLCARLPALSIVRV